jgi:hypothetical protein
MMRVAASRRQHVDVHPVHHAPRTWRDFFVHLATITIGLFIALTLQAGVESLHHRHLVREARENLRREIQINREHYAENVQTLEKNRRQLAHNIDLLRDLRSGKPIEKSGLVWNWDWDGFIDASWKTARETGAVSYMSFDLINAYDEIYSQQDYGTEISGIPASCQRPLRFKSRRYSVDVNQSRGKRYQSRHIAESHEASR